MMLLLSPTEQAYLQNKEQFSKAKQRYVKCRLKKKLRLLEESYSAVFGTAGPPLRGSGNRGTEALRARFF
jgi:hypothetical protein